MLDKDNIGRTDNITKDAENNNVDISFMTKESIGNVDFFKCRHCPYMALTLKDIKFHRQTSHVPVELENKKRHTKTISVKCPGCLGIFHSEISLKTHLKSHHKMCTKDINKLVISLVQEFEKKQKYIDNLEVVIEGHTFDCRNLPPLIEIPPDPGSHPIPLNASNIIIDCVDKTISNECDNMKQLYLNMGAMVEQSDKQNYITNTQHKELFNISQNNNISDINKKDIENAPLIIVSPIRDINNTPLLRLKDPPDLLDNHLTRNHSEVKKNSSTKITNHDSLKINSQMGRPNASKSLGIRRQKAVCKDENILFRKFGFKCDIQNCGLRLFSKEKIEYHRTCHTDKLKEFSCPECKTQFSNVQSIHMHLWKQHVIDLELLSCNKCAYKNFSSKQLNYHVKIHSEEKLYTCEVCTKAFKNLKQLHNHKARHKKDSNKIECDICNRNFSNNRNLKIHKESVHEKKKKLYCEQCQYSCLVKSSLHLHLLSHTGEKSLKCDECDFKTYDRSILLRHSRRHSQKKKYKCEHCSYSCIQCSSLKKHIKLKHPDVANDLIHSCPHCSYNTINKDSYNTHLSTHINEKSLNIQERLPKDDNMSAKVLHQSLEINIVSDTILKSSEVNNRRNDLDSENNICEGELVSIQNEDCIDVPDNILCEMETVVTNANAKSSNNKIDNCFNHNYSKQSCEQKLLQNVECFPVASNLTNYSKHNPDLDNTNNDSNMFEPMLVINDKSLNSENNITSNDVMSCKLLPEPNDLVNNFDHNLNVSSTIYENPRTSNSIFVKDILDLATSNSRTFNNEHPLPQNISTASINEVNSKNNSTPPILLINPNTQTCNTNMDLINSFTSNVSNYFATNSQNGFLHLPLPNSQSGIVEGIPRKKPKISVKSNLILKGPDNLNPFNLQQKYKTLNGDFNMNSTPFSVKNHSMPITYNASLNTESQIDDNSLPQLSSRDPFISDDPYNMQNYLLNSDFNFPAIQSSMSDNNCMLLENSPILPNETNNVDMSDVKLENKPYIPIQSESSCNSLPENYSSNASMMYEIPKHTIPLPYNPLPIIKFEQKSNMLGSYIYQDNMFDNNIFNNTENISVIEELPATFENMNSEYNSQSIYVNEDNTSYFENDLAIETLDENEIIIVDDASCDMKSLPSFGNGSGFDTIDHELSFDRFSLHNMQKPLRIHSVQESSDKNQVKEKPRIISEVHITSDKSKIVNFATVKNLGLKLEFPSVKNIEWTQAFLNDTNHKIT